MRRWRFCEQRESRRNFAQRKYPLRGWSVLPHHAFSWRNFNFFPNHRAGCFRPCDARISRKELRWWGMGSDGIQPRAHTGSRHIRGLGSNYLNIRRRRRERFGRAREYFTAPRHITPVTYVRPSGPDVSLGDAGNERSQATWPRPPSTRRRHVVARREREGQVFRARGGMKRDGRAPDAAVGGDLGVACCARY